VLGGAQPGGPAMRAIIHDIGAGLTLAPGDIALAVTELGLTSGLGGNTPSSEPWPVWAAGLTWLLGRRRGRRVYLTARGGPLAEGAVNSPGPGTGAGHDAGPGNPVSRHGPVGGTGLAQIDPRERPGLQLEQGVVTIFGYVE